MYFFTWFLFAKTRLKFVNNFCKLNCYYLVNNQSTSILKCYFYRDENK